MTVATTDAMNVAMTDRARLSGTPSSAFGGGARRNLRRGGSPATL